MDTVITPAQARRLLQEEQQARVNAAKIKYDAFVAEWQAEFRVRLDISVLVTARGNVPQMLIIADP